VRASLNSYRSGPNRAGSQLALWISGGVFGGIGLLGMVVSATLGLQAADSWQRMTGTADGVVARVVVSDSDMPSRRHQPATVCRVTFSFDVDGHTYRDTTGNTSGYCDLYEGDQISIAFNPSDPSEAALARERGSWWLLPVVFVGASALSIGVGVTALVVAVRNSKRGRVAPSPSLEREPDDKREPDDVSPQSWTESADGWSQPPR
jgi:hypothetical protein